MRQEIIILLSVAVTVLASPTLPWDSRESTPMVIARRLDRRDGLPPISQVIMALHMQTVVSNSPSTVVSGSMASSSTGGSFPRITPPYSGPGIVVPPEYVQSTTPVPSTIASMRASPSQSHVTPIMRHLAVVGGAFGILVFLVICCFFVMDPRIWKACSMTRKTKSRLSPSKRPLPQWMQITPSSASPNNIKEKMGSPVLSPYPYCFSDGLKSKFSMTTASDYSYCDDSFDTTATTTATTYPKMTTPFPYDGFPILTLPSTIYVATMDRVGRPITPPVRPPRPPTADSPATIESIYYTDVDDPGFYRHPNPIVLESNATIMNDPSPKFDTNSNTNLQGLAHLNLLPQNHPFFSSVVFRLDASRGHNRSKSAPTLDTLSMKSSKHLSSGASSITGETMEGNGSAEKGNTSRASTCGVSWIRYSEFQQQHHLQMISDNERPVLCPTED